MRYCFGEKIRTVRERRALTLREVADRAGVSESLVSQIERNRVSPAIDTLLALTDALDIDLEYLFSDYRRERLVKVTKKNERFTFTRPGVVYERLAQAEGAHDNNGIEAYSITIQPGAKTGSQEYGHPGWELGIIKQGEARILIGNNSYDLAQGDSVSFMADSPHILENRGTEELQLFWVITPSKNEIGNGE